MPEHGPPGRQSRPVITPGGSNVERVTTTTDGSSVPDPEATYWYRAGWDAGYEVGYGAAYVAIFDRAAWLAGRQVGYGPSKAELDQHRAHSNDPCPSRCDRCSSCIRAAAAQDNQHRYGSPDYPGAAGLRRAS